MTLVELLPTDFQEGNNAWGPSRNYVQGNRVDEIVWSYNTSTGEQAFHHYDARGHCTLLTDSSANILEQYEFDAFGQPYFFDASGNPIGSYDLFNQWHGYSQFGNLILFTGREWLADVRLYDFRTRMYQPELGRFMQPDPKEFAAADYNLYRYCHNDPINKTDPTGLEDNGHNILIGIMDGVVFGLGSAVTAPSADLGTDVKNPRNMIGPQIRRIRGQAHLTQIALAERCQRFGWDISRDTLAKIEGQSRWVADFELAFLARVLGVSHDALFPAHQASARTVRDFIRRLETITK